MSKIWVFFPVPFVIFSLPFCHVFGSIFGFVCVCVSLQREQFTNFFSSSTTLRLANHLKVTRILCFPIKGVSLLKLSFVILFGLFISIYPHVSLWYSSYRSAQNLHCITKITLISPKTLRYSQYSFQVTPVSFLSTSLKGF